MNHYVSGRRALVQLAIVGAVTAPVSWALAAAAAPPATAKPAAATPPTAAKPAAAAPPATAKPAPTTPPAAAKPAAATPPAAAAPPTAAPAAGPAESTPPAGPIDDTKDLVAKLVPQIAGPLTQEGRQPVMLARVEGGAPAAVREALGGALAAALVELGIHLVDAGAARAVQTETVVAGAMGLEEAAGAAGARSLVTAHADAGRVQVQAVAVDTGVVLASASGAWQASDPATAQEASTLQAQLRRLGDRLAAGLGRLEGEARYQRFAVVPFEDLGDAADKQLGAVVAAELATILQRDHGLMMVERAQLAKVLDELALGQSGVVDEKRSIEVGKLAGAHGLIVGSVGAVGPRYLVNVKVVGTADGGVRFADSAVLPAADLVALSSDAVVLRTTSGAVYRSLLLPGWGQFYNREPVKAAVFIGAEASGAALAVAFHLVGMHKQDLYRKATPGSDFEALRRDAALFYDLRTAFIIGTLAVHAVNVLDAFISGRTYDTPGTSGGSIGSWVF